MVVQPLRVLLLCLLLLLPISAQARLTLGWVPGAPILGSEEQARRLAAHLEARLAEPVVLRSCSDETQLQEWLHRYRMVDLAPFSQDYLRRVPPGQLLPVAELKAGSATATLVLRQGLRSDQQLQLRSLLANLGEDPAGRDLLAGLGDLRLTPSAGVPRPGVAVGSVSPAPPRPSSPAEFLWPDQQPAAQPLPGSTPVAMAPLQPEPEPEPEPAKVALPDPPAAVVPVVAEPIAPPAPLPLPTPEPEKVTAMPTPKAPVIAAPQVEPKLSEQTVSRSLSSGRQPLADGASLQTIYLVPFTTIMVPLPVAEAVFDQFVETLNETGAAAGYEFVILKDELERVDPTWLRKATYVTGEIFGYVEESGCCSTDIRSKSRLALYRPGSSEPKLRHEYPAKAFFDHDYSTLDAERKKLAKRISLDLSGQLLKALGGG